MHLHQFIRERDLPRNRVARIGKDEVRSRLQESWTEEELEDKEIEEDWPEIGLAVRTPAGSTRYQYEVTDPEAFYGFLLQEMELTRFLSEEDLLRLGTVASYFTQLVEGEAAGWTLTDPDTGERLDPASGSVPANLARQVRPVLERIGMDI